MKSIAFLLIIIAVLLGLVFWKLGRVELALERPGQDPQAVSQVSSLVESNHAMIGTMQKLQVSFDGLRQEIADFRDKLHK